MFLFGGLEATFTVERTPTSVTAPIAKLFTELHLLMLRPTKL